MQVVFQLDLDPILRSTVVFWHALRFLCDDPVAAHLMAPTTGLPAQSVGLCRGTLTWCLWVLLCCFDAIGFPGEDRSTDDLGSSFEAQLGRLYSFGVASAAPPFLSTGKGNDGGLQTGTFERGPVLESHRALTRFFRFCNLPGDCRPLRHPTVLPHLHLYNTTLGTLENLGTFREP